MTPATKTLPIAVPQEVLDFAAEQGVSDYLPAVLEMTNHIFPGGLQAVVVDDDPEIANDRHILIVVKAKTFDVPQALEARWQWHGGLFESCPARLVCVFRLDLSIAS
jgi:hypothetical protein